MMVKEKELIQFYLDEIEDVISEKDFQLEFFQSLLSQWETKAHLSDKQIDCLKRMYERVTR